MRLTWRSFPLFFWSQFLTGFCFHLILPVILLFLAGLVLGWIGHTFGLFYLVWHESPMKQAVVGFAVFHLAWEAILVAYLLETKRTPHADRFRLRRGGPAFAYFLGIILSGALSLGVVIAVRETVRAIGFRENPHSAFVIEPPDIEWAPPFNGVPFAVGALAAIILATGFTTLRWLQPRVKPPLRRLGSLSFRLFARFPVLGVKQSEDEDLFLHGVAAVSWTISFIFFFVVGLFETWFSPVVGLCCLLHGVIAFYAFLAFFMPRLVPALIALLSMLLWAGGLPHYKQHFPGLERHYANPIPLVGFRGDPPDPPLLKPDDIGFCARDLGIHPANTKRPLVIVCVSGGGLRSAGWTLAVLQQLEEQLGRQDIRFPYHIRLFSGASGGMLGASCYTLSLPAPNQQRPDGASEKLFEGLTRDSLSPVIEQLIYGDLWSVFWPGPRGNDRGRALERAWRDNLDGLLDASFSSLQPGEQEGWRPSLVFSPMLVEDGRRLLISNLDLSAVGRSRTNAVPAARDSLLSTGAFELFRLCPDRKTREEFKVATAARMSASFPYITPATPLPTSPRRRVVDAGYYDNFGVSLAAAWLMNEDNLAWMRRHVSGVLLVQIRDGLDEQERKLDGLPRDPSKPLTRGLEGLTSPPEGLLSARESASAFRNDEQLELLGRLLAHEIEGRKAGSDFFTTATFEFSGKVSLSWCLTPQERMRIVDEARTGLHERIKQVAQWWIGRPRNLPVK